MEEKKLRVERENGANTHYEQKNLIISSTISPPTTQGNITTFIGVKLALGTSIAAPDSTLRPRRITKIYLI